jgi:tRNA-2-methylthio-N6-dimethylallyladenosine synthase
VLAPVSVPEQHSFMVAYFGQTMTSKKKLFIKTFGCQMNEYDSDKMADVLGTSDGLERTDTPDDADIILFNTCSVREKAQEKVFSDLGRVKHLKKATLI